MDNITITVSRDEAYLLWMITSKFDHLLNNFGRYKTKEFIRAEIDLTPAEQEELNSVISKIEQSVSASLIESMTPATPDQIPAAWRV
jgi:hypothetical protein